MGRFFNVDKGEFIEGNIFAPPIQLIAQKVKEDELIKDELQRTIKEQILSPLLEVNALGFEEPVLKEKASYYNNLANEITDNIWKDPLNNRDHIIKTKALAQALAKDIKEGDLAKIQARYNVWKDFLSQEKEWRRRNMLPEWNVLTKYYHSRLVEETLNDPKTIPSLPKLKPPPDLYGSRLRKIFEMKKPNVITTTDGKYIYTLKGRNYADMLSYVVDLYLGQENVIPFLQNLYIATGDEMFNPNNVFIHDTKEVKYKDKDGNEKTKVVEVVKVNPNHWLSRYARGMANTLAFKQQYLKPDGLKIAQMKLKGDMAKAYAIGQRPYVISGGGGGGYGYGGGGGYRQQSPKIPYKYSMNITAIPELGDFDENVEARGLAKYGHIIATNTAKNKAIEDSKIINKFVKELGMSEDEARKLIASSFTPDGRINKAKLVKKINEMIKSKKATDKNLVKYERSDDIGMYMTIPKSLEEFVDEYERLYNNIYDDVKENIQGSAIGINMYSIKPITAQSSADYNSIKRTLSNLKSHEFDVLYTSIPDTEPEDLSNMSMGKITEMIGGIREIGVSNDGGVLIYELIGKGDKKVTIIINQDPFTNRASSSSNNIRELYTKTLRIAYDNYQVNPEFSQLVNSITDKIGSMNYTQAQLIAERINNGVKSIVYDAGDYKGYISRNDKNDIIMKITDSNGNEIDEVMLSSSDSSISDNELASKIFNIVENIRQNAGQ